ncbi:MAG: cyclic nucleotide-binding domain-containing protein, partial [Candidatus Binatia bacterium]
MGPAEQNSHATAAEAGLSTIPLFSGLDQGEIRSLVRAGTTLPLGARRTVFREGDAADGLYSVLSGELRIYRRAEDGSEVELHRVFAGEWFGEMALLDGGTRSASVATVTPCRLFVVSRESFLALLPRHPQLLGSLLANLAEHIRTTSQRVLREELEQRALRAEMEVEKYRSLTQMVAGVAHEINTPLGIVNTASSVVRERLASDALAAAARDPAARAIVEDVREAVALIESNVHRAHELVRSFKQLSVSQIVDVREPLSLPDVVDDAVAMFRISARRAKLDFEVRHELADRAAGSWLGYRGYLTQVL